MTGCMCRQVRFDRAVTGVAMSPSGDFVCTSHAGALGIYLWANRTHFANVFLGYSPPTDATGPPPSLLLPLSSFPSFLPSFPFLLFFLIYFQCHNTEKVPIFLSRSLP